MADKLLVRAEGKLVQRAQPYNVGLIQVGDRPLTFMTAIVLNTGGSAGFTNIIHAFAAGIAQQEREAPTEPVLQCELAGLVDRASPTGVQRLKVQELRIGSKQVAFLNRTLAQDGACIVDDTIEGIWNNRVQAFSQSQVCIRQLVKLNRA